MRAEVTWNLSDDGTLTISGTDMQINPGWYYKRKQIKKVIIENGVTNIGSYAFGECSNITSITIPNSVTWIGSKAFSGCSSLSSITIPNSVTSITEEAFSGCSSLSSITIPNSVTRIEYKAFYQCSALSSVTIGNSVTSIGQEAFGQCNALSSVTIGNSVKYIEKQAFYRCLRLSSITIPNSVTHIAEQAFKGCSLTSITIPNSVTYIGKQAFSGLSLIDFPNASNCDFDKSAFTETKWYEYWETTDDNDYLYLGDCLFAYKGNDEIPTIKNGTKKIFDSVFSGCSTLTSITIPNSVTSIGNKAFYECSGLTSVTIDNSATSIGEEAFARCHALTSVTTGNSVTSIGDGAFDYCYALTSITIPNSATSIGEKAFNDCHVLSSVTIGNSVTSIGKQAFYHCWALSSVTIGNSVTSIGEEAFCECRTLTSVTIPNSVTWIGAKAFQGCTGIKELYSLRTEPTGVASFSGMNTLHAKLFVPEGTAEAYKFSGGWKDFANIYEMAFSSVLPEAEPIKVSDGAPTVTNGYYKEKTMTYVREGNAISKDNYASFCLPFAVDPADAQFKAVYVPLGIALYNTEQNTLRLGFYKSDDIIPAGTPFFALLAVDDKVEIKNALPVNYDSNSASTKNNVVRTFNYNNASGIMSENNDYAINFSGTYTEISPTNAYTFNTDGSVGASSNVVPFRAYVVLSKNNTNAKIITSFDKDAETTGIKELQITNADMPIYDLNGRMVKANVLKSGIYIKNGKKYIK